MSRFSHFGGGSESTSSDVGTKAFILAEVLTGGLRRPVIVADDKFVVDLDATLVQKALTREMRVRHWGNLFGKRFSTKGRLHVAVGVSTEKVGEKTTPPAVPGEKAFFLGGALSLSPYVNLNLGAVVLQQDSSLKFRPGLGFSLDLDLLGAIFK